MGFQIQGNGKGLWLPRIFILPHVAVGLCALFAMIALPIWAAFGTDIPARVTGASLKDHQGKKGDRTDYYLDCEYTFAGRTYPMHSRVAKTLYDKYAVDPRQAERAPTQPATVPVRVMGIGPAHYADIVTPENPAAGTVGFVWFFGAFWNGLLSPFVYLLYLQPFLAWRKKRRAQRQVNPYATVP